MSIITCESAATCAAISARIEAMTTEIAVMVTVTVVVLLLGGNVLLEGIRWWRGRHV